MAQFPIESNFRPVNPVLQALVSGIANDPSKFKAGAICAPTPTDGNSSGTIMRLADADMFGDPDADYKRALGATAYESRGVELGNTTYSTQEYAAMVPADYKKLSRSQLPEQVSMKSLLLTKLMHDLMIARERRLVTLLTGGTYQNQAPGATWDNAASDPLTDFQNAVEAVAANGMDPDTIIIGRQARILLQSNDTFLEFLPQNADRGFIEREAISARLSGLYGVPANRIFYIDGRYNSNSLGQSATLANIMDDDVWVGHVGAAGFNLGRDVVLNPTGLALIQEEDFTAVEWDDPARNSVWQKVCHSEQFMAPTALLGCTILAV